MPVAPTSSSCAATRRHVRAVLTGAGAVAAVTSLAAGLFVAPPAEASETSWSRSGAGHAQGPVAGSLGRAAKRVVVPGNFSGLGFDTCSAPDQATMDDLRLQSPYWGVGVYFGGEERGCAQPELNAGWVRRQASRGWHIFPVWVGPQSKCADAQGRFDSTISASNRMATRQGIRQANRAVRAAQHVGLAQGSTLFVDVEAYDNTDSGCNQPVLSYQSGWDERLRSLGWKAGYYTAAASGMLALDSIRATQPGAYSMPDAVWFSHANGKPTTNGTPWVRNRFWQHARVHQYRIDVDRTFGDVTLSLDENAIEIGKGSVPGPLKGNCGGVALSFSRYDRLSRGDHGPQVRAVQCLLKQRGLYRPSLGSTYNQATARGVGRFQDRVGLEVTRDLDAATWTALLSAGPTPVSKRGSASDRVRAVQRALTAAIGRKVDVSGVFVPQTTSAVLDFQRNIGLDRNGVVGPATWKALQAGTIR
jgi:hypothetical protein